MIKQRRESIAQFEKAARQDLADKEKSEIAVLDGYMPQQLARRRNRSSESPRRSPRPARAGSGHGQGHGAAQAAPRRPRRHGQSLRPGKEPSFRAKNPGVIPDSFIQDLLNRVDIVDVVSRYVQLKKAGANYLGLLPVPRREVALVHGQPGEAVLSLLRLRRARHRDRFPDGVRRHGLRRRGQGARRNASGMQVPEERPRTKRGDGRARNARPISTR